MLHHVVIKDIVVREAGEGEIEKEDAEEGDDGKGEKLARDVVAGPCRRSGVETGPDGVEEVVVGDGQDEVHREEGESTAEDDGKLSSPSRQQHFLLQHTKSHTTRNFHPGACLHSLALAPACVGPAQLPQSRA